MKIDFLTSLGGFEWSLFYFIFFILRNSFSNGKIKNLKFEIRIIPQAANINNKTSNFNLHIIRKRIEYSLKNFQVFELFKEFSMKKEKKCSDFVGISEKVIALQAYEYLSSFLLFLIPFNLFSTGKIEKLNI